MYKIEELVEFNNQYRGKLNKENEKYYDDILVYIRLNGFFKDEIQIEESLLEILTDLIEAQNQGIKAEDYFGKSPKTISDDILKNINKISFKNIVKLFLTSMAGYLLITLLPEIIRPNDGLDLGQFFIATIITFLFLGIVVVLIGKSIFLYKPKVTFFIGTLLFSTYIGIIVLMRIYLPSMYSIKLIGTNGIIIILMLGGLGVIYGTKRKENYGFLPMIIISLVLGILSRLKSTSVVLEGGQGDLIITISVVIGSILFYLITYFQTRSKI